MLLNLQARQTSPSFSHLPVLIQFLPRRRRANQNLSTFDGETNTDTTNYTKQSETENVVPSSDSIESRRPSGETEQGTSPEVKSRREEQRENPKSDEDLESEDHERRDLRSRTTPKIQVAHVACEDYETVATTENGGPETNR